MVLSHCRAGRAITSCAIAVFVWLPSTVNAQGTAARPAEKAPSIYDKIWRFSEVYSDKSNPIVQRVLFTGRFHFDFADLNADQGEASEWNVRRLRLGPRITLFRNYTVHIEVELDPQEQDPFYERLTDAYVSWSARPQLTVTVGKQSVPFTQEGATSSRELLTIDRSTIGTNIWFPQEYMPGVSVSGRIAPWIYRAGIYSSGAMNREYGEFNGGVFTLGVVGYDLAAALGVKEAVVTGNYLYQQPDVDNTFTRRLEHVVSINGRFEEGRLGLRGDMSLASGYLGQSDMWAVMVMPYFNVTGQWQVVGRYTYLESDRNNGVQFGTYENRVVTSGRGDRYRETYLGVNYYFYGHRLKLQSGLHFGDMRDKANDGGAYHGTSWVTGLRVGW